jgi:hypothetical protein
MEKEKLKRANELSKEIAELDSFIRKAESVWTGKLIKRETKYIFKSSAYGAINSAELELNTTLKNKILLEVQIYRKELADELERL